MRTTVLFLMSLVLTLNISTSTSQANQLNGGLESTTNQERAREIMGENYFGIEEGIQHFGVNPSREQLASLGEIPFSEAMLEESKYTHVLVAVFPLSILDCYDKVDSTLFFRQMWYSDDSFAKERGEASWQLVRKTPVDNSVSKNRREQKNWQEQQSLLARDDEVPSARVMVYTIIGHYLSTGERLFERIFVRTSSVAPGGGYRVIVGYFDSRGLVVDGYWDGHRDGNLGVSSARKSPH